MLYDTGIFNMILWIFVLLEILEIIIIWWLSFDVYTKLQ